MTESVGQAALDRALDEKDLLLVYQPIHDARTREIFSAEALLRQRRQSGEIREASAITKAAEKGPELFELDYWTFQRAATDAVRWQNNGGANIKVNVNLSPRQFQEGDVLDRITHLVTSCGIDPHTINVEITETSYIRKPRETMDVLNALKKLGIQLWLDDFGTGHSTVEHVQLFPVDGLKIPGSFICCLEKNERCRAITRAVIRLAHEVGMKVIAEEVENEKQLQFLLDQECDYIQGFLFSKPMPVDAFQQMMTRSNPSR